MKRTHLTNSAFVVQFLEYPRIEYEVETKGRIKKNYKNEFILTKLENKYLLSR